MVPGRSPKTVVIVDDEAFILMMLDEKLRSRGYRTILRKRADDLLKVVEQERPDLIILDWMMPGISGIEALKRLRDHPIGATVPVFMLTARGQGTDEQAGYSAGVTRYLTKPFSPNHVLRLVEETVGD